MNPYDIQDTSEILSPGLIVFAEIVEDNIRRMVRIAGSPARLRPHCKTHKMVEVARMVADHEITGQKAATFAEAEMLVAAGVRDIFLAYNPVGPNIARAVAFRLQYPAVTFAVTGDHPAPIRQLADACQAAGTDIGVVLDLDTDQHRTGVAPGDEAFELYRLVHETPGLVAAGLHCYDGHHHQPSADERRAGVQALWRRVDAFRNRLVSNGLPVPRIVAGGTPSFPMFAEIDDPSLECSPGTCVFQDAGYGQSYQDLEFTPAALLLTRVISRPTANRITLDLGTKSVASDPPAGSRVLLPQLPDAQAVLHNEEHLVLETSHAERYTPGDELLAIPVHVCPTTALHKSVTVIRNGQVADTWQVVARDRRLNI